MIAFAPSSASRILCGNRTSTGTVLTVPAGFVWSGDLQMSASVSTAATGAPTVTVNGTGSAPVAGSIVHRLSITGLALTTVTDSNTVSVIVMATTNDITLDFNTGSATSASIVANGILL